ncbi:MULTISPECIES: YhjD/YihY/BrkB family envelope integrity protein [unclassified Streptomyces]|uniref:YhjD/YihY/BrkB family envelope integrity protein n=1 Tax=unclassified Streptomyces TaxID=2593676 RepID=UPI003675FDEF
MRGRRTPSARGAGYPSRRRAWWRARSRKLVTAAKRQQERAETRFPVITHVIERLIAVNVFDSATRLAAQVFLTAVPLLFVIASFAPDGVSEQLVDSVRTTFGLTGPAAEQVDDLLGKNSGGEYEDFRSAIGLVGGLMVLVSATAVSRAMQRLCKRAWEIPRTEARISVWRWVAWILVWTVLLVVQGPVRQGFGVGLWLGVPLALALQTAAWWWTQHLLLGGRLAPRALLPGAVLTAVTVTGLSFTAGFYMPHALNRALEAYGSTGPVFVLLSWLIVLCVGITVSMATGAAVAQEPYFAHRLGSPPRRARSGAWRHTPP